MSRGKMRPLTQADAVRDLKLLLLAHAEVLSSTDEEHAVAVETLLRSLADEVGRGRWKLERKPDGAVRDTGEEFRWTF